MIRLEIRRGAQGSPGWRVMRGGKSKKKPSHLRHSGNSSFLKPPRVDLPLWLFLVGVGLDQSCEVGPWAVLEHLEEEARAPSSPGWGEDVLSYSIIASELYHLFLFPP